VSLLAPSVTHHEGLSMRGFQVMPKFLKVGFNVDSAHGICTPCRCGQCCRRFGGERAKLSLCLVTHYAMKTYRESEGIAPSFLTSALEGCEGSDSRSDRFTLMERVAGSRSGRRGVEKNLLALTEN
jgi:hypothetical protein